jgi:enamine deaminase RidA (YjgF/YER057c/UK114 family)
MPKEYINPDSLFRSLEYGVSQIVAARGGKTIYISGQTAWDTQKQTIGGADLAQQTRQALRNVQAAIEAVGGTLADIVALRIYIVNYKPEQAGRGGRRASRVLSRRAASRKYVDWSIRVSGAGFLDRNRGDSGTGMSACPRGPTRLLQTTALWLFSSSQPVFLCELSDHLSTIFVCFSKSRAGEKRVLGVISAMKSRRSFGSKALLILACVCAISISMVAQARPPLGRVVVKREPSFGWNLAFHLQIDGTSVATVGRGHDYDAWLPAGRHLLTVNTASYVGLPEPTSTIVDVEPGQTYLFTVMWDSNLIFLRPSGVLLTPGKLWELRPRG